MAIAAPLAFGPLRRPRPALHPRRHCRRHRLCRPGAGAHPRAPSGGHADAPRCRRARRARRGRCRRWRASGTARSCRSTSIAWSRDADVVFLALPEAASAELAPKLLERGVRVIDLSGAFRIRGEADRQRWYPGDGGAARRHGLRDDRGPSGRDPQARLVSNPGCYPTAALLRARAAGRGRPARRRGRRRRESRASRAPARRRRDRTHFSENHGSVAAYAVFSHRHTRRDRAGARRAR